MELVDAINFGITIGLGVLSLGVSILSVILAIHYANESNDAFEKINSLTNEIKLLSSETFTNQQKYSDKMLDTIIQQSKYGIKNEDDSSKTSDTTLKIIADGIKEDLENKIDSKIAEATKGLKLSAEIKNDITKNIRNTRVNYDKIRKRIELPENIKRALISLQEYPAHYILIRGIVLSNSTSLDELRKHVESFQIPDGWDSGPIDKLIELGILIGSSEKFSIAQEIATPLQFWVERNENAFKKILRIYDSRKNNVVTKEEKSISLKEIIY
jgi:hypothetical protein